MRLPHRYRAFGAFELSLLLAVLVGKSVFLIAAVGLVSGLTA